jgi:thioredoxin-related protein
MKDMKKLFVLMFAISVGFTAANATGKFAVGEKAVHTDVKMTDVSGKKYSIDDVKGDNGVLVLFSSNTCPFVLKWEGRYIETKKWADQHKVGMIVLNSNCSNRNGVDSMEEMKKHAAAKGYNFPYVVDGGSKIANAFVGQTTPHAFLFDKEMKLVYKGAIDDNHDNASAVKNAYLKDAIAAISKGQTVKVAETKPVGCSIKRVQ